MNTVQVRAVRSVIPDFKGVSSGLFEGFRLTVRRGVSLGLVLFLALSTLSILNRGTDFLQSAMANSVKSGHGASRNLVIPRRVTVPASVYAVRTPRASVPQESARETLRETGYFLNELKHFTQTLARFGK